jgi:hypothetical protein
MHERHPRHDLPTYDHCMSMLRRRRPDPPDDRTEGLTCSKPLSPSSPLPSVDDARAMWHGGIV